MDLKEYPNENRKHNYSFENPYSFFYGFVSNVDLMHVSPLNWNVLVFL